MAKPTAYLRLLKAVFTLAREGVFSVPSRTDVPKDVAVLLWIADRIARPESEVLDRGERLNAALDKLGPSYIKLGQFLATRPDIVGNDIAKGLGALRDDVPAFGSEAAREIIRNNLNRDVEKLYSSFSEPVAAASIAQVHKATITTPDGEREMAVKVLRPNVRARFQRDLESFYAVAHLAERFIPSTLRLRPVAVVDTLARSVVMEMDLRLEAAALSEMADQSADDPLFSVPKIDWSRTGRDVLTIDWVDGLKLTEIEALDAAGLDRKKLATDLIQVFLRHALEHGFFHADMHQGNLFVHPDGTIIAIDFGIMGRIGPKERQFLAEILYGFVKRDYLRVAQVHFEAGYVPAHHSIEDFAQALRAVGEPIHGQSADDISMASLLGLLFEITELFDMETRTELIMLQKTMVVVEGVSRSLDDGFDMWQAAEPVLREWLTAHLGPGA
ncbi:MAG: 2-polyprenylphenol 6-hydroxylase, partial [Rhizobiales bacterium]|nr:2-polyprenylphenol 6-hydroxylase [Hyphomicrobiales bacterium]